MSHHNFWNTYHSIIFDFHARFTACSIEIDHETWASKSDMDSSFEDICLFKPLLHNPGHNCKNCKDKYCMSGSVLYLFEVRATSNHMHPLQKKHTSGTVFCTRTYSLATLCSHHTLQKPISSGPIWSHENYDVCHLRFLHYHHTKLYSNFYKYNNKKIHI